MTWPRYWRRTTPVTRALSVLTPVYLVLAGVRRRRQLKTQSRLPVPVLIVGNLVVGGTGKTPFIEWLAARLPEIGVQAGIVSRGYGAQGKGTILVSEHSLAGDVGDEPLLLARATGLPVCVGRDRPAAVRRLIEEYPDTRLIISDDGLQHYRLPRQLTLCLFDGHSGAGNGRVLPAGPLREPLHRAGQCDLVITKGRGPGHEGLRRAGLQPAVLETDLAEPQHHRTGVPLSARRNMARPIAVCGIGQPNSFFRMLQAWCPDFDTLVLSDHGRLSRARLVELQNRCVVMTPKDAVKLPRDHGLDELYIAQLKVGLNATDRQWLLHRITAVMADFGQ